VGNDLARCIFATAAVFVLTACGRVSGDDETHGANDDAGTARDRGPNACAGDTCAPDLCADHHCDTPLAPACIDDEGTAATYAPGICNASSGACTFSIASKTACETSVTNATPACADGACGFACNAGSTACANGSSCCHPALVLFSGDGDVSGGDTWTFDGTTWSRPTLTIHPPQNSGRELGSLGDKLVWVAWDDPNQSKSDTWTFDGGRWTKLATPHAPSSRWLAGFARLADELVLFGGGPDPLSDTWTFDGADWTQLTPATSPPPIVFPVMAPLGNEVVVFGNYLGNDETWSFDGATWTKIATTTAPPITNYSSFVMATLGSVIIGFGAFAGVEPNDTWAFDGADWKQLHPAHSPSTRCDPAIASFGSEVVLFGGSDFCGTVAGDPLGDVTGFDDTWVFDGTDWTELTTTQAPSGRDAWGQMTILE
jgi:hypothetical protein